MISPPVSSTSFSSFLKHFTDTLSRAEKIRVRGVNAAGQNELFVPRIGESRRDHSRRIFTTSMLAKLSELSCPQ